MNVVGICSPFNNEHQATDFQGQFLSQQEGVDKRTS